MYIKFYAGSRQCRTALTRAKGGQQAPRASLDVRERVAGLILGVSS